MSEAGQARTTIWERDQSPVSRRWWRWALPIVGVLVAFGIVSEVAGVEGGGTLAGLAAVLGALMLLGPWIAERRNAVHPTVSSDGSSLFWAREVVPLAAIETWVVSSSTTAIASSSTTVRSSATQARFTLADGSTVTFGWQGLGRDEGEALRQALEGVIGRPPVG